MRNLESLPPTRTYNGCLFELLSIHKLSTLRLLHTIGCYLVTDLDYLTLNMGPINFAHNVNNQPPTCAAHLPRTAKTSTTPRQKRCFHDVPRNAVELVRRSIHMWELHSSFLAHVSVLILHLRSKWNGISNEATTVSLNNPSN